jgi:hypothetical protein
MVPELAYILQLSRKYLPEVRGVGAYKCCTVVVGLISGLGVAYRQIPAAERVFKLEIRKLI